LFKVPPLTFFTAFVWATRRRSGEEGEWRNFEQLLRTCIVIGNPSEIEIGRGSGS